MFSLTNEHVFTGAQANAGEGVILEDYQGDKISIDMIKNVSECIQHASNPDIVSDMEEVAAVWCKQIEQVSFIFNLQRWLTELMSIFFVV